jgi:hypothetical protein
MKLVRVGRAEGDEVAAVTVSTMMILGSCCFE